MFHAGGTPGIFGRPHLLQPSFRPAFDCITARSPSGLSLSIRQAPLTAPSSHTLSKTRPVASEEVTRMTPAFQSLDRIEHGIFLRRERLPSWGSRMVSFISLLADSERATGHRGCPSRASAISGFLALSLMPFTAPTGARRPAAHPWTQRPASPVVLARISQVLVRLSPLRRRARQLTLRSIQG
jgi:hypothetical protein